MWWVGGGWELVGWERVGGGGGGGWGIDGFGKGCGSIKFMNDEGLYGVSYILMFGNWDIVGGMDFNFIVMFMIVSKEKKGGFVVVDL